MLPNDEYLPRNVMHAVRYNEWTLWKGEDETNPILFLPSFRLPASQAMPVPPPLPPPRSPKQAEPFKVRRCPKAPNYPPPLAMLIRINTFSTCTDCIPFTK